MSRAHHLLAALAGLACACGEPLDRVDGALVVSVAGAPAQVDRVGLTLEADGRTFELERARPEDDLIEDFSAVPAGPGMLAVRLFRGPTEIAKRDRLEVEIPAGGTVRVDPFTDGPELRLGAPAAPRHPRWSGPIFVEVEDRTAVPPSEIELEVWVDDTPVAAPAAAGASWFLQIDPALAGDLLPRHLDIRVQACFRGLSGTCTEERTAVEVHRQAWRGELRDRAAGAALHLADRGWLVVADEAGYVHVFDVETGELVQASLRIGEELLGAPARAGDVLAVADREGAVHGLQIEATGLTSAWSAPLSAPRPSPVVSDARGFFVADQRAVLALDAADGAPTELGRTSAPIVAAPLPNPGGAGGVVVADLLGQVLALDGAAEERFRVELGSPIYAPPVADGDGVVVATSAGDLHALDSTGAPARAPVALGAPVVFPPVASGAGWAVAAARSLVFVDGADVKTVPLGERVIGAPAPWPGADGGVVLGLFNGRVVVVRPAAPSRTLAQLEGLALAPTPLDAPWRAVVGTSLGALEALRAEEDF